MIDLYTWPTPNGWKIGTVLAELAWPLRPPNGMDDETHRNLFGTTVPADSTQPAQDTTP